MVEGCAEEEKKQRQKPGEAGKKLAEYQPENTRGQDQGGQGGPGREKRGGQQAAREAAKDNWQAQDRIAGFSVNVRHILSQGGSRMSTKESEVSHV
jgi:hypothetical protein